MKKAWVDIKSFMTVAMIILLFIIVIANLLGATLEQNVLLIITNLATSVFTYYFTKKDVIETEKESEDNDR